METEIIAALKTGDLPAIQHYLAANPTLADGKTSNDVSFLMLGIYYGHVEIAALLKQYKSQIDIFEAAALGDEIHLSQILATQPELINSIAPDGFTPLGLASYFLHPRIVSILLSNGADPNLAAQNKQRVTPLHSAVAQQSLEIAALLIQNDADVNVKQEKNITPLQQAAHRGQLDIVQLLLDHGADKNAVNDDGKSALDYALADGHDLVVDFLKA